MAFSPLRLKAAHHSRSLSLPSESHPSTSQFDETLSTIKASKSTSSFNNKVNGLKNLYQNFDDLLLLPNTKQTISQESQEKWIDQLLDGHITLLDACSVTKDLFSQMKHSIEELLSALRRKDVHSVECYMTSRKKSTKMIQKSLKDLRSAKGTVSLENDNELVCMLKEAESATFVMLESLLSSALGSKMQARRSSWSLVSKLMKSKKVSHQGEETDVNEFTKVDALLQMSQDDDKQVELMNHLKEMDSNIRVLEEELECLFRQLIKTRVSILNIINY